ncbi:MAG: hypothetical protein V3V71_05045 [Roseateles sp.]
MWLVAIALPLQGWASASMLCCGPDHHHVSIGSASVVQSTATSSGSFPDIGSRPASSVESHEAHGHQHGGHDHPADDHAANAGSSSQPDGVHGGGHHDLSKPAKTKCSVCASCCTIAALPSRTMTVDEAVPIQGVVAWTSQAAIAFLTSGPERPPRTSRS